MAKPLVSVIIPVRNTGKVAIGIIDNLLRGTYSELEIIVVDDGSTDDSLATLKQIKDKRVKVFNKPNGGASSARNYGIKKATGTLIAFVDSDDGVKKTFIEKLVSAMDDPKVALAATGLCHKKLSTGLVRNVYLDEFSRKPNEKLETYVLRSLIHDGRMYPVFNKLFRTDIINKNKVAFDETLKFAEDTKFVLDYLRAGSGDVKFVLEPLYIYNYGTETSSVKKLEGIWKNWQRAFKNLKAWVGKPDMTQKKLLSKIYLKWRLSWIKVKYG